MASVNKWIGIGNLGRDPEIRYTSSNKTVASFSIACSESWKDKTTGEKIEKTEWVNLIAFDKLADICGQYLHKGSQVYVEGKLKTDKYQRDGQDHYSTKVIISDMRMLGKKGDSEPSDSSSFQEAPRAPAPAATPAPVQANGGVDFSDDIPF